MSTAVVPGLVSVVVASYNHARYLSRRMQGLINQSYPSIEILVIDDCSPDNSVEVLRKYADHPLVKLVLREKNGGWVTVSNQGIDMATGEFILFANCDDDCEPRMIERLVGAMNSQPAAGIAFCRSQMIDEMDQPLGDDFEIREPAFRARCLTDTVINGGEMRRFLLHSCVIPNLSAMLIRKSCLDQVGKLSPDYRACSDWDLFFRVAHHHDFAYVAEPLNRFRQHGATIRSATKGRITYDEFFRLLLGEIRRGGLSAGERFHHRLHVMYLWAVELIGPSLAGWRNLPHHIAVVWRLDAPALSLLPLALIQRLLELPAKVLRRLLHKRAHKAA